jgi:hypothetical protein
MEAVAARLEDEHAPPRRLFGGTSAARSVRRAPGTHRSTRRNPAQPEPAASLARLTSIPRPGAVARGRPLRPLSHCPAHSPRVQQLRSCPRPASAGGPGRHSLLEESPWRGPPALRAPPRLRGCSSLPSPPTSALRSPTCGTARGAAESGWPAKESPAGVRPRARRLSPGGRSPRAQWVPRPAVSPGRIQSTSCARRGDWRSTSPHVARIRCSGSQRESPRSSLTRTSGERVAARSSLQGRG